MALSPSDPQPKGISVADAYSAIRAWYKSNVSKADARGGDYGRDSAKLIRFLPPTSALNDLEQRAILREVILGYLEWGYHQSDAQYKMAAYAHAAFEARGSSYSLSSAEKESLNTSQLWPYLSLHV
jgi:hypothetical protein